MKIIKRLKYWLGEKDNVSEKDIIAYLKKKHKNYIWNWTTVDEFGYPQIILSLYDPKTKKYSGWKLVKQIEIKESL